MTQPPKLRPSSTLVSHDIAFWRVQRPDGRTQVVAHIECERRASRLDVDGACRGCERFARIEVHEGDYCMLCRSQDEVVPEEE